MDDVDGQGGVAWATMARETFEFNVVPWAGRPYAEWVRAWARAHPGDPRGLVQLPEQIYHAFQQRTPGQRLSRQVAASLGYPSVPGEQELARVRKELHDALLHADWDQAHDLDSRLRNMQASVEATRLTALKPRQTQLGSRP
jgi:hypothetical protein